MKFTQLFILTLVLLGVFLIVNLYTVSDYGISWDEPVQQVVGEANLDYISSSSDPMLLEGDLIYYGPFYETLNRFTAKVLDIFFQVPYIPAHHVLGVFFSTLGLLFLFLFARKMFSEKIAFASVFFMMFFPLFIAHLHYNTKDIPLLVLTIIALYFMYRAFSEKKFGLAVFGGMGTGFALATKIHGLLLFPIFFLPYLLYLFWDVRLLRQGKMFILKEFKLFLVYISSTVFFLFLAWPRLFVQPLLFFQTIYYFLHHSWAGYVLYFGTSYYVRTLPWHYAPVMLALVTPIFILLCFFIGFFFISKKLFQKEKRFAFALVLSWFLIPLLVEMKPGTIIYDGIRHFFFIVPAYLIICSFGIWWIIEKVQSFLPRWKNLVSFILFFSLGLFMIIQIVPLHPYEGSYYNEAVRFFIPEHIEKYFEIETWATSYQEGIEWLQNNAEYGSGVCVPLAAHLPDFYPNPLALKYACKQGEGKYIMLMTRTREDPVLPYTLLYKVNRYNSDLLYIYQVY